MCLRSPSLKVAATWNTFKGSTGTDADQTINETLPTIEMKITTTTRKKPPKWMITMKPTNNVLGAVIPEDVAATHEAEITTNHNTLFMPFETTSGNV